MCCCWVLVGRCPIHAVLAARTRGTSPHLTLLLAHSPLFAHSRARAAAATGVTRLGLGAVCNARVVGVAAALREPGATAATAAAVAGEGGGEAALTLELHYSFIIQF